MGRVGIGLIIGLLVGGTLVFYFFVGVPRAAQTPGAPILPPDHASTAAGTAQIVLRQDFFNNVLDTIFRDMKPPAFPLGTAVDGGGSGDPAACNSEITIFREGSGVTTSLSFENNTISAPLAFSGSYSSPVGCLRFTGWAKANLALRYDASRQSVFGQVNVETVNLDGVNPLISGFVTPLVQTTLNNRVNPITLIDGRQIAINVPVTATKGEFHAAVSDVRAEVVDNALDLYVVYDFHGQPAKQMTRRHHRSCDRENKIIQRRGKFHLSLRPLIGVEQ